MGLEGYPMKFSLARTEPPRYSFSFAFVGIARCTGAKVLSSQRVLDTVARRKRKTSREQEERRRERRRKRDGRDAYRWTKGGLVTFSWSRRIRNEITSIQYGYTRESTATCWSSYRRNSKRTRRHIA